MKQRTIVMTGVFVSLFAVFTSMSEPATNDAKRNDQGKTSSSSDRINLASSVLSKDAMAQAFSKDVPASVFFNCVGFRAGAESVPFVPAVVRVQATGNDDTGLLQAAIDHVATLPVQPNGFRGAVLLDGAKGFFQVLGQLHIRASGVVLRGTMEPVAGITATGHRRRTLIEIGDSNAPFTTAGVAVTGEAVPAGSVVIAVAETAPFSAGDRVVVTRPSTREWIASLGMDQDKSSFAKLRTHWMPGSRDLMWDRQVVSVDSIAKRITLDAPITTALEQRFGGGIVAKVTGHEPVQNIVVEDLELETKASGIDEEHAWIAVAVHRAEDVAVLRLVSRGFAGSAVRIGPRVRRVTIHRCINQSFASAIGGYRRQTFLVEGQQVLVAECRSDSGLNDFAVGHCAAGPNVFRDCEAIHALGPSGSFESWASGVLYERVKIDGAALHLTRDDTRAQGGGWTAANSFVRDCAATGIVTDGPPGAPNIVLPPDTTRIPVLTDENGRSAENKNNIPLFLPPPPAGVRFVPRIFAISGGRFVTEGRAMWGGQFSSEWWRGQIPASVAVLVGSRSITRFVPGREGPGLTENMTQLADDMMAAGKPFFESIPGLWYDRRRDDHLFIARPDANVWAPFFEMPWLRSGQGIAFDGLSKFDLNKFNPWYFDRLHEWAWISTERGFAFTVYLYNTHNVLETQAHWVDYPWRPVNNINETGLQEPPPVDENNAIHLADQVYDVTNPVRRTLHRALIRRYLDELGEESNVIFSLSFQFAGPLSFQKFFLDMVAEWEREKGKKVKVALVTSKDITDAILTDPLHAPQVDVIDMRYWQRLEDGSMWAPRGDRNRAFREQSWEQFGGESPPNTKPLYVYRQVREYRDRFPSKAIIARPGGCGSIPILLAGGACNPFEGQVKNRNGRLTFSDFVRDHLADVLPQMTPRDGWLAEPENNWCLADNERQNVLIYSLSGRTISWTESSPPPQAGLWFNPRSGETMQAKIEANATITKPTEQEWLLLLHEPH